MKFKNYIIEATIIKFDDVAKWAKKNKYILAVRKNSIDMKNIASYLAKDSTTVIQVADKDMNNVGTLKRNDKSEKTEWLFVKK